jgi:hypothetical protein
MLSWLMDAMLALNYQTYTAVFTVISLRAFEYFATNIASALIVVSGEPF